MATCCGPSTTGFIANDMGFPAWSINGSTTDSQAYYLSGALSTAQMADIASQGFIMTLNARALQGSAPIYDPANPFVFAFANLDTGVRRFDIWLGIDSNGDTVVALPTSYGRPAISLAQAFGSSFTLTGSGSSYHSYQLVYNPSTQLADLFVDGVAAIKDYAGNTSLLSNWGLGWGVISGGQGNFNFVQLATPQPQSVPEPASLALFGMGLAGLGFMRRRKAA